MGLAEIMNEQHLVALYMSAWIEIMHHPSSRLMDTVALYMSAWIEITSSSLLSFLWWSHST